MASGRYYTPARAACGSSRATATRSRASPDSPKDSLATYRIAAASLDGEIVCLDPDGKPQFRDLLFRRAELLFYAFDILWDEHAKTDDDEENSRFRNGEDLRYMPLIDRKLRLHAVVPKRGERLLDCDHIDSNGEELFRLACENDLEGIVAKRRSDPYLLEHATWLKIRNHDYSQWVGREELFEREGGNDPDVRFWDECVAACNALEA